MSAQVRCHYTAELTGYYPHGLSDTPEVARVCVGGGGDTILPSVSHHSRQAGKGQNGWGGGVPWPIQVEFKSNQVEES